MLTMLEQKTLTTDTRSSRMSNEREMVGSRSHACLVVLQVWMSLPARMTSRVCISTYATLSICTTKPDAAAEPTDCSSALVRLVAARSDDSVEFAETSVEESFERFTASSASVRHAAVADVCAVVE